MFYRACKDLSSIHSDLEDQESAIYWSGIAESIKERTNKYLWQSDKGFYRMHIHVTPLDHSFDESNMFPMGGNAVAVCAGLANRSQAARIFDAAEVRKKEANATTIGCVLTPSYPNGFFANPIMDEAYEYQNGGQWDWFAGRLILAEFENGFSSRAISQLGEISRQDNRNNGLYEWYTLNGIAKGSPNFTGSAGVLGQCIIEGYFGIYLSNDDFELKPRLGNANGSIALYEPTTNTRVFYNYTSLKNNTTIFRYTSNTNKSIKISILVPTGKEVSRIYLDKVPLQYKMYKIANDAYISYNCDVKTHECKIIY
jgi:hypothetical protein